MWIVVIIEVLFNFHHLSSALENMALGKPVWEDRPWRGPYNWRGDRAVDGFYRDRSAQGGQCVISENRARTATWRVDLGGVVSISHIDIYYRTDNTRPFMYTSRMAGFFLYVSNTTSKLDGHLCFHEIQTVNSTPSEDQRINCSVHGRYVTYYNERLPNLMYPSYYSRHAYYELCELEVYGCSNVGFYGQNCIIPCPRNCQERRCDINTGHCLGCAPGYRGPTCDKECKAQSFGLECFQTCGNCSYKETCHHVNGTCLRGCDEGVTGVECKTECSLSFYGPDCAYNCSENCNVTRRCNRFTGECEGGCKAGWTGTTCDKRENKDPLSNCDNNLVVIPSVLSVVIVLTGSVLNYVYWKRKSEHIVQERKVKELTVGIDKRKTKEKPGETSEQYTELQEVGQVNPYEELQA